VMTKHHVVGQGWGMAPTRYRIIIGGRLSERFVSTLDHITLDPEGDGTALIGEFADQAQLFGVLDRLRDFGIEVVGLDSID
jgi:hypothetical protein